jgi:hypothetical protein
MTKTIKAESKLNKKIYPNIDKCGDLKVLLT